MTENTTEDQLQAELDIDQVKKRSVAGVLAITSRTLFLQGLAIVANFLFGIFLLPEQYGVFYGVSAVIEFFIIFSDVGLAAALIQKKSQLNKNDYLTTFTIQQVLVNSLVIIALIFSRPIANFYHLSTAGLWLFRALAASLTLASLKTIPSIKLERHLEFSKLIIPQLVENVIFYTTAVYLAWRGYGVTSFTIAVLLRGIAGVITIYWLAPWRPGLKIDKQVIKELFSFGVPFQLNSIIAFVKDKLIVAYLFKALSAAEVGYIGFAQKWSLYPLQLVMESINKVSFPTYSRLQEQKEFLRKAIEKSLFFVSLLVFPLVIGLVATAPALLRLIPKYQKWLPALIALSLFSVGSLWSSVSTTLTNSLAAIGKIKLNLKLMVMWTTLTWIFTPLLVMRYGYNGAAMASAIVAFTSVIPILIVRRLVKIKVMVNLVPNLFSALVMGAVAFGLSSKTTSLIQLAVVIVICALVYLGLSFIISGKKIKQESALILQIIKLKRHV